MSRRILMELKGRITEKYLNSLTKDFTDYANELIRIKLIIKK